MYSDLAKPVLTPQRMMRRDCDWNRVRAKVKEQVETLGCEATRGVYVEYTVFIVAWS